MNYTYFYERGKTMHTFAYRSYNSVRRLRARP